MKNKKGFTLIELLAVIVILAVIALITTTIITKVVENSRKNAAKNSALNYLDSVEKYIMYHEVNDTKYSEEINPNSLYQISNKEYIVPDGKTAVENKNLNDILGNTVKGEKPDTGIVEFDEKRKIVNALMTIEGYNVACTSSTSCNVEGKDTDLMPVLTIDEDNIKVTETKITIPYTVEIEKGSATVECVYGTDENYGQTGVINEENNTCTLSNLTAGITYYYKLTPKSDKNKKGTSQTSSKETASYVSTTNFKVGDYVYMVPSYVGSYTPTNTGTNSPESITPSELDTWVVIKNENGTIEMVSLYTSSTVITLNDSTGYNNAMSTFDDLADKYANSNFTNSSRFLERYSIGDYGSCNSGAGQCPLIYDTSGNLRVGVDGNLILAALNTLKATDINLNEGCYWMAVKVHDTAPNVYDYLYKVTETGGGKINTMSAAGGFGRSGACKLRPILTLKSDVVAQASGDGSKEKPWVLVEQ